MPKQLRITKIATSIAVGIFFLSLLTHPSLILGAEVNLCMTQVGKDVKVISFSLEGEACLLKVQDLREISFMPMRNSKLQHTLSFYKNGSRDRAKLMSPNGEIKNGNVYRCPKNENGWWIRWRNTNNSGAMDGCMKGKRMLLVSNPS